MFEAQDVIISTGVKILKTQGESQMCGYTPLTPALRRQGAAGSPQNPVRQVDFGTTTISFTK